MENKKKISTRFQRIATQSSKYYGLKKNKILWKIDKTKLNHAFYNIGKNIFQAKLEDLKNVVDFFSRKISFKGNFCPCSLL